MQQDDLANYAHKLAARGLTAGAGGNISYREGDLIWIKPSGFTMEDLTSTDLCALDIRSGRQISGPHPVTSEYRVHVAIYQVRPDITAVFHVHPPWACGVISAGVDWQPMFPEVALDLGPTKLLPYTTPGTDELAAVVATAAKDHETILLANHGIVALGRSLRQAYERCCIVEDAAKSWVAAVCVGKPQFLSPDEVAKLRQAPAVQQRAKMLAKERAK